MGDIASFAGLFLSTFEDFRDMFFETARMLEQRVDALYQLPEESEEEKEAKTRAWFFAKIEALDMLSGYDRCLIGAFREKEYALGILDMQQVGEKIKGAFSQFDRVTDTRYGNDVFSLRYGTIIASIIGKNYLFRAIREECPRCEAYIRNSYPILVKIDIGNLQNNQEIKDYAMAFHCKEHDIGDICWRETEELKRRIEQIDQDRNYFSKHIFATGLTEFPGLAYELQLLKVALKSK